MRRLDHSAIFVMIAGSFTPICLLVLPDNTGIQLLFIIWIIAGIGILQTVLFTETPRLIRAGIYLVAGYMAIPYLSVMFSVMSMTNFTLTAASVELFILLGPLDMVLSFQILALNILATMNFFIS